MARLASLIAALLGIVFTSLVWADALPTAKPEDVGLSSERLARVTQPARRSAAGAVVRAVGSASPPGPRTLVVLVPVVEVI